MGSFSGSLPKSTSGSPTSVPDTPLRFGSGAPNLGCPKLRSPNPSPPLEGPPGTGPGTEVPGKGPKGRPAYSGLGVQKWGFGDPPFGHLGRPPWGLVWGPWPKPRFPDPPLGRVRKPHFSRFGRSQGTLAWDRPNLPKPSKSALFAVSLSPPVKRKKRFRPYIISLYGPSRVSAGGPPQKVTFSQKSDFLRVPPKPRFGTGLGPVWDRSGTGLAPLPTPPPQGGKRGGKVRFPTPQKLAQNYGQKPTSKKGLVSGPSQTYPPTPPKGGGWGGRFGGYFWALLGPRKSARKPALFSWSVFDHNFGLVFGTFSNLVKGPKTGPRWGNYFTLENGSSFLPPH
jgi:hypothetical protein